MILVIAPEEDEVAAELSAIAEEAKVACCQWPRDRTSLRVSCTVEEDGRMRSSIVHGGRGVEVKAILNRGVASVNDFANFEEMAALWAAIVAFDGRVVNRPNERGFLPRFATECWNGVRSCSAGLELDASGLRVLGSPAVANAMVTIAGDAAFTICADAHHAKVEAAVAALSEPIAASDVRFCSVLLAVYDDEVEIKDFDPCPSSRRLVLDRATRTQILQAVLQWMTA